MEPKKFGMIIGRLLSAYDALEEKQKFVKRRLEESMIDLCKEMPVLPPEKLEEFYKEFVEGVILVHTPLRLLSFISSRLPGEPILMKGIPSKGEAVFRDRKSEENLLGANESGKLLIKTMVNAVIDLSTRKRKNLPNRS